MPAGGSLQPASAETVAAREHFLSQNGKAVFKFAVSQMAESVQTAARSGNGLTPADVADGDPAPGQPADSRRRRRSAWGCRGSEWRR